MDGSPLGGFSAVTRSWFEGAFTAPTDAQEQAWRTVRSDEHALVVAPTGSGKTLAAFLWSLDRLATSPQPSDPARRCRVLYVSPLKALAVDVERNLRAPLTGMRQAARRLDHPEPDIRVAQRTGDTPATERRRFGTDPPDVLITTPESLFLVLTSQARESLRGVETVIVDEVHAVAGTKRGAHLALSLERVDALLDRPAQRIGLSATVRPVDGVARFLGGSAHVSVVQPRYEKAVELEVAVPVPDMRELGQPGQPDGQPPEGSALAEARTSIWPHLQQRLVDLIEAHRSTIVFTNSRRLAERLCARLNETFADRRSGEHPEADSPAGTAGQAGPTAGGSTTGESDGATGEIARAHHGSVSKDQRARIEEDLKAGRLPAVVATSSLELGIDMGAVDLVVQVESPPSVASGMQRIGRGGHQVGATSHGVIFPKYRGDLVQTAVVAERMRDGAIEETHYPHNPLDVLAQQVVAMVAMDEWGVEELAATVRRAAPYATLPATALESVLDMLAGRYPSDEFAELRPRLVWDRIAGTLRGRPGAQRLAVTSGGTIPDRGLFGVFLAGSEGPGRRVGELDEEMVYESRAGEVFTLGSSSWRIEDITHDRVLVSPAPGQPGKLPFWHGDAPGRPAELGRALGAFVRELSGLIDRPGESAAGRQDTTGAATDRALQAGLDMYAATNLVTYLTEQREATGYVPDDRTLVVERCRDELGDWRVVVHSPYGAQVHAPWAQALTARLRERYGVEAQAVHSDDGIVLRVPDTAEMPAGDPAGPEGAGLAAEEEPGAGVPGSDLAVFTPEEVEPTVTEEIGNSALFAARFRECAARALLLPRRRPGSRAPLWQQRQRSAQLLSVARQYGSFPVVLEAVRECLQDVFDVPGLVQLMRDVQARRVRLVEVQTSSPSPFARSLLFGYVGAFMYEGDAPLAERRAQALTLDTTLLAELLGQAELRELLDAEVVGATERELQRLTEDRQARDGEDLADLLRVLGPLSESEAAERGADPSWLVNLEQAHRAIRVRLGGMQRWAAIEDAGRLRDAVGTPPPVGVPEAFLEPVPDPLRELLSRYARTHGPFAASDVAAQLGLGVAVVTEGLRRLAASGRVAEGEFRPGGSGTEWCDVGVLRTLRRRSLARLRQEVEPVPPEALVRFLPVWHSIGAPPAPSLGGEPPPRREEPPGSGQRRQRRRGSPDRRLRGADGVLNAVEQLAGAAVPASSLERLVLPSRVADYSPALLDELTASGEVVWSGRGALPGGDGWVALYPAEAAPLLAPEPDHEALEPTQRAVLDELSGGGALFFRDLSDRVGSLDDRRLVAALWDLVWAGHITNDTLAPLRNLLGTRGVGSRTASRQRPRHRPARPRGPSRTGPPTAAGRWSLLGEREPDPTRRAQALTETVLDRHGVVTRGSVAAERIPGGFAAVYPALKTFEESGHCRRGYFVEGLGAAQFAAPGAVDRMRALAPEAPAESGESGAGSAPGPDSEPVLLAAADPANPYGAALDWPRRPDEAASGHKPGRKAGALVVLLGGALVLYVERGGRTLLSWTADPEMLRPAAEALAGAVRAGWLSRLDVQRADGAPVQDSPLGPLLQEAGFRATPQGLRLRT